MSEHLCHWTRKDMRRVADACEQLDVDIEHVIVLDLLSGPECSIFDDPVDDLLDTEDPEELESVFGKPLGGHVYKAGAGPVQTVPPFFLSLLSPSVMPLTRQTAAVLLRAAITPPPAVRSRPP